MKTYREKNEEIQRVAGRALTIKKRLTRVIEFRCITRRKEEQQFRISTELVGRLVSTLFHLSHLENTPALEEMISNN
jgi:hypothetical protein